MVVSSPAAGCNGQGHSTGDGRVSLVAHSYQATSGANRIQHRVVGDGEVPQASGVTSSHRFPHPENNSTRQGCCAEELNSSTFSARHLTMSRGRLAEAQAHLQRCELAKRAEKTQSQNSAEVAVTKTCRILRFCSTVHPGKLPDRPACPVLSHESSASWHLRDVFVPHARAAGSGNIEQTSNSWGKSRANIVNRITRCRPLVRAVSASGVEFASEEEDVVQENIPTQGSEHGLSMGSSNAEHGAQGCCSAFQQNAAAGTTASGKEQELLCPRSSEFFGKGSLPVSFVAAKGLPHRPTALRFSSREGNTPPAYPQHSKTPQDRDYTSLQSGYNACHASGAGDCTRHISGVFSADVRGSSVGSQQQILMASVMPSRETLVRRLLPAVPEECVALRMKSSIESLYDDSVAALQSSQCSSEAHSVVDEGVSGFCIEDPLVEEARKGAAKFDFTTRTTTAASSRADEQGTFSALYGEGFLSSECEKHCRSEPSSPDAPIMCPGQQVPSAFGTTEQGRWDQAADSGFRRAMLANTSNSMDVMFMVCEDWEVFTLLFCSHTGAMHTVASTLNRISTLDRPPQLCSKPLTMALGGSGCQNCDSQRAQPCKGWWRSRYVLLRVTVSVVGDCSTDLNSPPHLCNCSPYSRLRSFGPFDIGGESCHEPREVTALPDVSSGGMHTHEPTLRSSVLPAARPLNSVSREAGGGLVAPWPMTPCHLHETSQEPNIDRNAESKERFFCSSSSNSRVCGDPGSDTSGSCEFLTSVTLPANCISRSASLEVMDSSLEAAISAAAKGKLQGRVADLSFTAEKPQRVSVANKEVSSTECDKVRWLAYNDMKLGSSAATQSGRRHISSGLSQSDSADTTVIEERQSRLASLLSAPCDSFEGFTSGVWNELEKAILDCPAASVFGLVAPSSSFTTVGDSSATGLISNKDSKASPAQREFGEGDKVTARGFRLAARGKSSIRRSARISRSQLTSQKDKKGGVRSALDRCYAACARTIGTEAIAEAQHSLGLCEEERELATVFLDFVKLVAPGAASIACSGPMRCRRRQKPALTELAEESRAATLYDSGCKRKQNILLRLEPGEVWLCCTKAARTADHHDATSAAHSALLSCPGDASQSVQGSSMV